MLFRQILHADLGCASYVVADAGIAAIVDPKWEIEDYLELADEHGLEIRYVLETHNHADHVSGRGRLATATGATIYVSPTPDLEYDHETLADGQAIEFGSVRIEALATPGHRPEHTAYVIYDRARGNEPWGVLTGDSLFVGDVARPDLAVEAEEGAHGLHASLDRLLALPDHVQIFPGHLGGSLCGSAAMSEAPTSTIGFERRFNRVLQSASEDEFVARLTGGLKAQPPNFRRIVALNQGPLVTEAAPLDKLGPERVAAALAEGATLLDGREPEDWAAAHVPGSVNATMVRAAVGSRAASAVDPEAPVVVTAASAADARRMARRLEAVGFRNLLGVLAGGIDAWRESGRPIVSIPSIGVAELARRLTRDDIALLDVRDTDEWASGHVPGSLHVPYQELRGRELDDLRNAAGDRPLAVACSAGNRAALAASLLEREGLEHLLHVGGGGVGDLPAYGVALTENGSR